MTAAIVLDKKRMTTTGDNAGRYAIKIRVTKTQDKKTIQKYYPTGYYATPEEFEKINGNPGKNKELAAIQTKVRALYEEAKRLIDDNRFIDLETFGYELTNAGNYKDPLSLMESYAKELRKDGNIGSANYYVTALNSFKEFSGGNLTFAMVTPQWLMKYEKWMRAGDKEKERAPRSITTVGMYCIAMRTIFNLAIRKKKLNPALYPFGKGKYGIPTSKGRKLALNEEQKDKILKYRTLDNQVQKAIDMFIFSYFCYGMNFADIARLRFMDIKDNNIVFDRTKTKNTERNKSLIEIPMRDEVWAIIKKWGNYSQVGNPSSFIFPVLRDGLTPDQVHSIVHDFIKDTNEQLQIACKDENLNIPYKITTYWARHTFATIAYKKGAGIEFIQKALGHSDPKTTIRYIESFDLETRQMVVNWL